MKHRPSALADEGHGLWPKRLCFMRIIPVSDLILQHSSFDLDRYEHSFWERYKKSHLPSYYTQGIC